MDVVVFAVELPAANLGALEDESHFSVQGESMWMMASASSTLNPSYLTSLEADRRVATRRIRDLRYYNGDVHRSAFALPNFVRALVS